MEVRTTGVPVIGGAGAAAGGGYSAPLQAGQAESGTAHHRRRGLVEAAAVAAVFG